MFYVVPSGSMSYFLNVNCVLAFGRFDFLLFDFSANALYRELRNLFARSFLVLRCTFGL